MQDFIFKKSDNIIPRKIEDEYVLVPLVNNIADMNNVYTLGNVAAFIWEAFDGNKTVKEIVDLVVDEFDVNYEIAKNDVLEYIKELQENKIIDKQITKP